MSKSETSDDDRILTADLYKNANRARQSDGDNDALNPVWTAASRVRIIAASFCSISPLGHVPSVTQPLPPVVARAHFNGSLSTEGLKEIALSAFLETT